VNAKKKNWNDTGIILEQYWNNTLTDTGTILSLKKNVCASREIQNVTKIFSKRENLILFSDQNEYLFFTEKEKN